MGEQDRPSSALRYSLRGLLIVVTIFSIVLAVIVQRAKEQRRVVASIVERFGEVKYDHAQQSFGSSCEWCKDENRVDYFFNVVWVNLDSPKCDDALLQDVAALPKLDTLFIQDSRLTNQGLTALVGANRLRHLVLNATGSDGIDDGALGLCGRLGSLEELEICGPQFTDAGVAHLYRLKHLKVLRLLDTQITDSELERLQLALPGCDIST